jgi:hypothetical protein
MNLKMVRYVRGERREMLVADLGCREFPSSENGEFEVAPARVKV